MALFSYKVAGSSGNVFQDKNFRKCFSRSSLNRVHHVKDFGDNFTGI